MIKRTVCEICKNPTTTIMNLPEFPLTGIYVKEPCSQPGYDTSVQFCESCSHAQMETVLPPAQLYGKSYWFRTSTSPTAITGIEFFKSLLFGVVKDLATKSIVEVGSNDLYLAKSLAPVCSAYTAIDPIWIDTVLPHDLPNKLKVLGGYVEDCDIPKADILISEHTLEHVSDPHMFAKSCTEKLNPNGLLFIEIPSLEHLVHRSRFDQFFHQHLNVFSLRSLTRLFSQYGCELIRHEFNPGYWGSLICVFRKGGLYYPKSTISMGDMVHAKHEFYGMLAKINRVIDSVKAGYGAAQIAPTICYHLNTDLSTFNTIYDEDPRKTGLYYPNLKPQITRPPEEGKLPPVLVLALDQVKLFKTKLGLAYVPLKEYWS